MPAQVQLTRGREAVSAARSEAQRAMIAGSELLGWSWPSAAAHAETADIANVGSEPKSASARLCSSPRSSRTIHIRSKSAAINFGTSPPAPLSVWSEVASFRNRLTGDHGSLDDPSSVMGGPSLYDNRPTAVENEASDNSSSFPPRDTGRAQPSASKEVRHRQSSRWSRPLPISNCHGPPWPISRSTSPRRPSTECPVRWEGGALPALPRLGDC